MRTLSLGLPAYPAQKAARVRTIILRLADQDADDELHGLLERPGDPPVPFSSAAALLDLLRGARARVPGVVDEGRGSLPPP